MFSKTLTILTVERLMFHFCWYLSILIRYFMWFKARFICLWVWSNNDSISTGSSSARVSFGPKSEFIVSRINDLSLSRAVSFIFRLFRFWFDAIFSLVSRQWRLIISSLDAPSHSCWRLLHMFNTAIPLGLKWAGSQRWSECWWYKLKIGLEIRVQRTLRTKNNQMEISYIRWSFKWKITNFHGIIPKVWNTFNLRSSCFIRESKDISNFHSFDLICSKNG